MNVMMISEKDAANASLGRIADAFLKKGDNIRLFATYYDEKALKYFSPSIPRNRVKKMTKADIEWCDIIVCSTLVSIYVPLIAFAANKPIFTHNYMMNRQINWGGDICFAPTQDTVASDYDEYLNYSYIGIGEPKYDSESTAVTDNNQKRFLFIDSGHYPFSIEGKRELAKLLLHICHKYPDYELVIKPRFLPGDKVITHRNDIHLYDVIKNEAEDEIPQNLIMLDYHEDLRKLIDSCCTVICMYTTAFVGAVVAGKGLIILENLPTTDVYDIRHKTYMRNRENMLKSGALVDYRHVDDLLPEGAIADKEYLDFLLEEKENVSDKIVEVCTYLYKTYFSKGLFPKLKDSSYKSYKQDFTIDENMTWERMVTNRCHDYILLKSLILIDFHAKSKLDISFVLESAEECVAEDGRIYEERFREFLGGVNTIRDKCIINNRTIMLQDSIDAGILLNAYYLQKMYDEIRNFPVRDIAAYDMFRAFVALEDETENDQLVALECLKSYYKKSADRMYNLEISDMSDNKFKAYEILVKLSMDRENAENIKRYIIKLAEYYKMTYFTDSLDETGGPTQEKRRMFIIETMQKLGMAYEEF